MHDSYWLRAYDIMLSIVTFVTCSFVYSNHNQVFDDVMVFILLVQASIVLQAPAFFSDLFTTCTSSYSLT